MSALLTRRGPAFAQGAALAGFAAAAVVTVLLWSRPTAPPRIADSPRADAYELEPLQVPPLPLVAPPATQARAGAISTPRPPPNADEGIAQAAFRRVVNGRMGTFQGCYERSAQETVARPGRVAFRITIGASGLVSEAQTIDNTFGDPVLERCILMTLKRLQFPSPGASSVSLTVPFVFQPGT